MSIQLPKVKNHVKESFSHFPDLENTVWKMYKFDGLTGPTDVGYTWNFLKGVLVQDNPLVWTGHWNEINDVSININAQGEDNPKDKRTMELTFITDSFFVAKNIDSEGKYTIINIGWKKV
jgi:hypothetical protein